MVSTERILRETAPMPVCTYSIRAESPQGEIVRFATVGQKLFHVWRCQTTRRFCFYYAVSKAAFFKSLNETTPWKLVILSIITRNLDLAVFLKRLMRFSLYLVLRLTVKLQLFYKLNNYKRQVCFVIIFFPIAFYFS